MLKNISNIFRSFKAYKAARNLGTTEKILLSLGFFNSRYSPSASNLNIPHSFGFSTQTANSTPSQEPLNESSVPQEKFKIEVVERVNQALQTRSHFAGRDNNVNKLMTDLKNKKKALNYYDSLMVLSLTYWTSPYDSLVKTFPNDILNAYECLKKFIENPDADPELMQNHNIFKLLIFMSEQGFKQFHQQPKQMHNIFSKLITEDIYSDDILLDILINKLGYINKTLYDRRNRNKVLDTLRAVLIISEKVQLFGDLPQYLEKHEFVLSEDHEKKIFKTCNIVNHLLQEDPSPVVIRTSDYLLNLMTQLTYITKLSTRIVSSLLEAPYYISNNSNNNLFKYGELLIYCTDQIIQNGNNLSLEKFTRICFMISRLNLYQISYQIYNKFIHFLVSFVGQNMEKFNHEMMKSILYTIGLHALMSPEIKQMYARVLTVEDLRTKKDYPKYPVYIKNLLQSALNVYAIEKGLALSDLIKYIVQEVRMAQQNSLYFDLVSFTKIAMALRRTEIYDQVFWEEFFKRMPDIAKLNKEVGYDCLFLMKTFEIYKDDLSDPKSEGNKVYNLYQDFKEKHSHIYEEIMKYNMKDIVDKGQFEQISGLQNQIRLVSENLGKAFKEEALIEGFMYVDFLYPELKTILELQGPSHFIKPESENSLANLITSFKIKTLRKLGYKLILIPYNISSTDAVSFDSYLLQKLQEASKQI